MTVFEKEFVNVKTKKKKKNLSQGKVMNQCNSPYFSKGHSMSFYFGERTTVDLDDNKKIILNVSH